MIEITSGKMNIPENERFIGFAGDNLRSTKTFVLSNVAEENRIYRLYLTFGKDSTNHFVLDSKVENGSTYLEWNISEDHILKSGLVKAQIKAFCEDEMIFHTDYDYFIIAPTLEFDGFSEKEISEFLEYEKRLNEILSKITSHENSFVPSTRNIAGLSLQNDITAELLCDSMKVYPILRLTSAPTKSTIGKIGQLAFERSTTNGTDFISKLYICSSITSNGDYVWLNISTDSTIQSDYVSDVDVNENGELEISFSDGQTKNLGSVIGDDCEKDSVKKIIDEVFELSKTAIPKTFDWEQGYLDKNAVESDSDKWYRSDFVEIDDAFKYYLFFSNTTDTAQSVYYWLFDENKTLIGVRITLVTDAYTQKEYLIGVSGAKFIRVMVADVMKDAIVRFYRREDISHTTKKELKQATYGKPRSLSMLDYFGANKKVVLLGDSITQGLGSSEFVSYSKTDSDGNSISMNGNNPEYGVLHKLPTYEVGKLLYKTSEKQWYEAIDGNGYAHKLKNYLQNKYGCTVKNYGMSGITSGTLIGQTMNSDNSELVTASEGTVRVFQGLTKGFNTVFIMVGTNDRGFSNISAFEYNLNWIVNYLLNTDHKKVVLMCSIPAVNENTTLTMSQINEAVKTIAETHEIPFISLYEGMTEYCETTGIPLADLTKPDGIHPNDEGYAVMQSIICDKLGISEVDKSYVDKLFDSLVNTLKESGVML